MNNFLQAAKEATKIASKVLLSYKGNISSDTIESKGMGDWVSEADRASEEAIIQYLSDRFPDHDILTEETGLIKSERRSKYRWIIDPLDGTTNFLRGLPIWAVSIGLEERSDSNSKWGEIIVGAIEIPMLKELFWASRNEGAFCNGKQIFGGKDKTTKDCLLATGFPFRTRHLISPYMELFSEIMQKFADVRRPGAVAADLCYLAAGIYDGFWELDLAPWDLAAGSLIVREAGGLVKNFQGGDDFLTSGDIVAAFDYVYSELSNLTNKYFPKPRNIDKSVY